MLLLLSALILVPAGHAVAQEATTAAEAPMTGEQLDELIRKLEDPAERDRLIQQLKALQAAQAATAPTLESEGLGAILLSTLSDQVRQVSSALVNIAKALLELPRLAGWLADQAMNAGARDRLVEVLTKVGIIIGVALAFEWLGGILLGRPRRALESRHIDRYWLRLVYALGRLILLLLPIIVFIIVAYGILPATDPSETVRLVALAIINANIIARVVAVLARILLAPAAAGLRLWPMGDETAHYLFIWVRRIVALSVYGYFIAQVGLLLGLPLGLYAFVMRVLGLFVAAMLIIIILQNRRAVTRWLKRETEVGAMNVARDRLAELWHGLAILYVIAAYGTWALDLSGGFNFLLRATALTGILLTIARLFTMGLRRGVERGFALSAEMKARHPGLETRVNRYLPLLHRFLRIAIYAIVFLSLSEIWGFDTFDWMGSETGRRIVGGVANIAFFIVVAMLLWEGVNQLVARSMHRGNRGEDYSRSARVRTLLPLLRNAFRVVLVIVVSLVVLSEVGINIAPLLAGAGVIGLAVGFGAQTLVKDVITGIFILAEDTIAVGDVIDLEGHSGVVEAITIRNIRLRDHTGAVHTIPFSAVTTVKNMSREFGYAVFDVGISYREDLDRVIAVLTEIGEVVSADAKFGRYMRAPIEVAGIQRFADSAIIIRARIKTAPGQQWAIEREFNLRLKKRFDELGIERANPPTPSVLITDSTAARPTLRTEPLPQA